MTILNPKRWNGWSLTAVALFVFAGYCFSPRVLSLLRHAEPVAQAATGTALRPITRPIEDLQPGDRVLAHNPEVTDAERLADDPDPATWRLLTLELTSGDGHRFDIRLLRPVEWVTANEAVAGGTVWLEMPEIGLSADANVTSIDPCPPIKPGRGRVITGTFRHESADTVDVAIEGQPPLGCTGNHPFWSEDRHDFIQARQLHPGERLKTVDNRQVRVTSITPRPHTEPVYNLEVDVEHVYYVGDNGVLVHNNGGPKYSGLVHEVVDEADEFAKLGKFRQELGMPKITGDRTKDKALAKFEVNGKEYHGMFSWAGDDNAAREAFRKAGLFNSPSGAVPTGGFANHAEGDVFLQAFTKSREELVGATGRIFIDATACEYCGLRGGLIHAARGMGLKRLEIFELQPNGEVWKRIVNF